MNDARTNAPPRLTRTLAVAVYFAAAKLLLHFLFNGRHGYFRDELYFLACGACRSSGRA